MIRQYTSSDHAACIGIFDSNCPQFFDISEREYFDKWLDAQDAGVQVYKNSAGDFFMF